MFQIERMDNSTDKVLQEASAILDQAAEWSEERIEENSSFILECARVVLSKRDTAGHEVKLECLKWLADLADSVPGFNLDRDVNKPFLEEANFFLDSIYDLLTQNGDHSAQSSSQEVRRPKHCQIRGKGKTIHTQASKTSISQVPSSQSSVSSALELLTSEEVNSQVITYQEEVVKQSQACRQEVVIKQSQASQLEVGEALASGDTASMAEETVAVDDRLEEMLLNLVFIVLEKMRKVVSVNSKLENVGAGDLVSLLELVPLILIKTFQHLDNLPSHCDGWKIRAKDVMIVYFDIVETVQFRLAFEEEREVLNTTFKSLLTLQYLFVSLDRKFGLLSSCVFGNLTKKFFSEVDIEKYQKGTEKICFKLGEQIVAAVKKLNDMHFKDLELNMTSDHSSTEEIRELLLLLSEISPLPMWLGLERRDRVVKFVQEMLESGVFDPLEISVKSESVVWKEFVDFLDTFSVRGDKKELGNDVISGTGSNMFEDRDFSAMDTTPLMNTDLDAEVIGRECIETPDTSFVEVEPKHFFTLSPSFPLTPMSFSKSKSLPESFQKTSPPDLSNCCPIPGALGSFFILSSLAPIVKSQTSCTVKGKKQKIKKKKGITGVFEKKVQKSKLLSLNLQKQRLRNISRFKLLIKEKDGVFKCDKCGMETGWKSKAWNHATRCGLVKKPRRRRINIKTCSSCKATFKTKKELVKHFQAEHQICRYVCVLCSKPVKFKFKQNFRRHHTMKHSSSDARPVFRCNWCCYKASQKYNLVRHVKRVHKSVALVSSVVDFVIHEAVSVISLCKYERIRRDNMIENGRMLEILFPTDEDKQKMSKPKESIKKTNVKGDSQVIGPSTRAGVIKCNSDNNDDLKDLPASDSGVSKKLSCHICYFKCSQKHSLKRHIVKKHEPLEEQLPCPRSFCNLSFFTRWEKEEHVAKCWLVCQRDICNGKQFRRPEKYQQHLRMHRKQDEKLQDF